MQAVRVRDTVMLTFSQRMGLKPIRSAIQVDSLDEETRNALWNVISPYLQKVKISDQITTCSDIWVGLYHQAVDTVPGTRRPSEYNVSDEDLYCRHYRAVILEGRWNECLDLIEFLADDYNRQRWNNQSYNWVLHQSTTSAPTPACSRLTGNPPA